MNQLKSEDHSAAQTRKSSGAHSDSTIDSRFDRKLWIFGLENSVNKLAAMQSNPQAMGLKPMAAVPAESERPYQCDICNQKFCQSSNLKRHMLIHTGERPFVCTVCNRTFTTASNMKIHTEIHKESDTRDKHRCIACNKSFFYKCSLVKHQKKCQNKSKTDKTQDDDEDLGEEPQKLVKKEETQPTAAQEPSGQATPMNPLFGRSVNPLQTLLPPHMLPGGGLSALQSMFAFPMGYQQLLMNQMLMDSLNLSMMRNSSLQEEYLKSAMLKMPSSNGNSTPQEKP